MDENDVYKAVSDLISERYEWLSDESHKEHAIQYVLGLNDMTRYLVDEINMKKKESSNERESF